MKTATLTTLLLGFVLAAACSRKHHEDESIPEPQPHMIDDEESPGEDVNNTVPDEKKEDQKKAFIHQATETGTKTDTALVTNEDSVPKPEDTATCTDVTITHTVVTTATAVATATDTSTATADWDKTCIPPRG